MTVTGGYSINDSPLGYQEMQSLYAYYKVHNCTIDILCTPSSLNNNICVQCAPSTSQITTFTDQLANQPYGKSTVCTASRPGRIRIKCNSANILGLNRTQYLGLVPALMPNTPTSAAQWFFNAQWQTADNTPATAYIGFVITITMDVEVSEPNFFST